MPGPGFEPEAHVYALEWELNLGPFGVQANTITIEQHCPGHTKLFLTVISVFLYMYVLILGNGQILYVCFELAVLVQMIVKFICCVYKMSI